MQNKAAIAANATQQHIAQETAERQRNEEKAGKQLERVQQQMADFVHPWQQLANIFFRAYERAVLECGCEALMAMYAMEWFSPPTQPYATVRILGNPKGWKLGVSSPFGQTLPPEDLARLAADPTRRARWEELMVHTVLPPLRELVPVLQSKVRTN